MFVLIRTGGVFMKNKKTLCIMAMAISLLAGCNKADEPSTSQQVIDGGQIKLKEETEGVKFLYGYTNVSQQFDWEEYARDAYLTNYYYYDLGNSTDNKIVLNNPEDFAEYETTTRAPRSTAKKAKRLEGFAEEDIDEEGNHVQFQGPLTEDEFFSYSATLTKASATAGTKKLTGVLEEDLNYIYLEMDEGFKSIEQTAVYSMYDNNIMVEDVIAKKSVAVDEDYEEHEEVVDTSKTRAVVENIGSDEYFIDVTHQYPREGEQEPELQEGEKYPVPENYRSLVKVYNGKNQLADQYTFSMQSGLSSALSRENFYKTDKDGNADFNRKYEWLSSEIDEETGDIKLIYNRDWELEGIYAGQHVVDSIFVNIMNNGKVRNYGYDYAFYYYGEALQTYKVNYKYDYESVGEYTRTAEEDELFDYNKYYDRGTLLPTIESQALDDQAESLFAQIEDAQLENKVNQPTGAVYETYSKMDKDFYFSNYYQELYQEYSAKVEANGETPMSLQEFYETADYDYDYEVQTKLDSSLYNDNVVVSYYSEQGAGLDEYFYAESGLFQRFNADGNSYELRKYNGNSTRYEDGKITTPNEGGRETKYSLLSDTGSVNEVMAQIAFLFKESKKASSNYTIKITAEKIEAGVDKDTNEVIEEHYVITAQATVQQATTYDSKGQVESNKVGVEYTYEIGFKLINK